jgi:hydrogenase-4 component F
MVIIVGAFQEHRYISVALFLLALTLVGAGVGRIFMSMSYGETTKQLKVEENTIRLLPSYVLLLASVALCIWMPDIVYTTILDSIKIIGGTTHG